MREGKLEVAAPAPIAAWHNPGDPRAAITLDNLLRMTGGLAIAQTGSGFDPAARMLYSERDMAGFATRHPLIADPGTQMRYSDASTLIVSRIVRDAAGGTGAAVQGFARRELFDPLGMDDVVMEADATGTPVGSTIILATARDWARFGVLYADDGVVAGRRIPAARLGALFGDIDAGDELWRGLLDELRQRRRRGGPYRSRHALRRLLRVGQSRPARLHHAEGQARHRAPRRDAKGTGFGIGADLRLIRDVLATLGPQPAPACSAVTEPGCPITSQPCAATPRRY